LSRNAIPTGVDVEEDTPVDDIAGKKRNGLVVAVIAAVAMTR